MRRTLVDALDLPGRELVAASDYGGGEDWRDLRSRQWGRICGRNSEVDGKRLEEWTGVTLCSHFELINMQDKNHL